MRKKSVLANTVLKRLIFKIVLNDPLSSLNMINPCVHFFFSRKTKSNRDSILINSDEKFVLSIIGLINKIIRGNKMSNETINNNQF